MKHLHRLIAGSSAYRMSSSSKGMEENASADPDNRLMWRRLPQRVESQVVRDTILALAGTLDTTMGGPPVPKSAQEDSLRRSLYFFHSNNERNTFLTMFDEALVRDCYKRDRSIVPQQALALSNAKIVLDSTPKIVERIDGVLKAGGKSLDDDAAFVRQAFVTVLAFEPSTEEVAAAFEAMRTWRAGKTGDKAIDPARAMLIWALINHNDFVTLR